MACGSDADAAQDAVPGSEPEGVSEAVPSDITSSSDLMPTEGPALPGLMPGDVSPDEPMPVRELRDAVVALIGQTITIQGDAASAFSPSGPAVRMSADPSNMDAPFLECVFPAEAEGSLPSGATTVRGTLGQPNFAGQQKLTMTACSVVEDSGDALSVSDLAARIAGWNGIEVAVVGTFNGATTSRLRDGDTVELTIQDDGTEGLAEDVGRCRMPAGSVAPDITERNGIIFRGTIEGSSMFWGADSPLLLSDCVLGNR